MSNPSLTVYGASWCPDCRRSKEFLTTQRIGFTWIDLETTPEAVAIVEELNDGKRIIPTIVFDDGTILVEPSNDELADKLNLPREASLEHYDVVIVGGGPTGLTAAMYAAREKSSVLIVEKSAPGGQAGVTERFDNYPGFPEGIGGADLAQRFVAQAQRYCVEILQAVAVTGLQRRDPFVEVTTSTGATISAKTVLIATGSTYRRTEAQGESDLIGAGVHFCATCDGPFYNGASNLAVIGGGNSGLEEGLFLTQFADCVTILQGVDHLTGSKLLQEKVLAHPKMVVHTSAQVTEFVANDEGKLDGVRVKIDGEESVISVAGAFVFIGLDPNTSFLNHAVEVDERGFVTDNRRFETSMKNVFVAGDVRSGSTKQLASAVGDGAAAAIQLRYALDEFS